LVNLLGRKVERGLVLCAPGVSDHIVQATCFIENVVDGGLDGFFFVTSACRTKSWLGYLMLRAANSSPVSPMSME